MAQNPEKNHSIDEWNNHKINELLLIDSANAELPENIKIIDGKTCVTARWLASRFNISYLRILLAIHEIDLLVHIDNSTVRESIMWVNDDVFVELCQSRIGMCFSEEARMMVLHLLGHYQQMEAA